MESPQATAGAEDTEISAGSSSNTEGPTPNRVCLRDASQDGDASLEHDWRQLLYQPLDASNKNIRVLKISPAQSVEAELTCTLHTVYLSDVRFAAVSYVWGTSGRTRLMKLNGHTVPIGRNAHAALRHIRHMVDIEYVWIDSLCINQADTDERGEQVALMGDIYSKAEPVYLWTGRHDEDTITFWKVLKKLKFLRQPSVDSPDLDSKDGMFLRNLETERWMSIAAVLENPFWRRLWILQEIVMGAARNQAVIFFGQYHMPYATFLKAVKMFLKVGSFISMIYPSDQNDGALRALDSGGVFHQHVNAMRRYEKGRDNSFDVLDANGYLHATNAKDRVYGLLGLVRIPDFSPNYKTPLEDIYRDITLRMFMNDGCLDVLGRGSVHALTSVDMSSWAIDWSGMKRHKSLYSDSLPHTDLYDACGGAQAIFRHDGRWLTIRGLRLFSLGPVMQYYFTRGTGNALANLAELQNWMLEQAKRRVEGRTRSWGIQLKEAFRRALLLDVAFGSEGHFKVRLGPLAELANVKLFSDPDNYEDFWDLIDQVAAGQEPSEEDRDEAAAMVERMASHLPYTSFAVGPKGECCLLTSHALEGDLLYIVAGCYVPIIIRPVTDVPGTYFVVGSAYVHGVMDGEAVAEASRAEPGDTAKDFYWPFEEIVLA